MTWLVSRILRPFLPHIAGGLGIALALALLWGWRVDHLRGVYKGRWHAVAAEYAQFRIKVVDAAADALRQQMEVNAAQARKYKEQADEADRNHRASLADARAAADDYIRTHRVRPTAAGGGAGGQAATPAQGDGAGLPESMPADAVVVSGNDVHTCSAVTQYALDAYKWANGLGN